MSGQHRMTGVVRSAMVASLCVSVLILFGKVSAFYVTGSRSMLSDAAESVVHLVATAFAALSLWYSSRPADETHPYGHGRIVYFSVGFEGALVFVAALSVIGSGLEGLISGVELRRLDLGLVIAVCVTVVNLTLGLALKRIGKRTNTLVLVANGTHVMADVWTTAVAIVGVGLVRLTGVVWLDPAAAVVIGLFIMFGGLSLLKNSVAGLMDRADRGTTDRIVAVLEQAVSRGAIAGFHQLRFRRLDDQIWIDVHLLLEGEMPVSQAHERATAVEVDLNEAFDGCRVHVSSHMEPEQHEAAHPKGHEGQPDPLPSTI